MKIGRGQEEEGKRDSVCRCMEVEKRTREKGLI